MKLRETAWTTVNAHCGFASEQGAKIYELRAAMSLVKLCRGRQGEHDARTALERINAEFIGASETPDRRAAAAILQP